MTIPRPVWIAALALAACAHPLPPLRSTPMYVAPRADGGYRPYVKAQVAGKKLELLIDTGATQSVLPWWFVQRMRLPTRELGDRYVDANGQPFTMWDVNDVPVLFEGEKQAGKVNFLSSSALAYDFGILAPQSMVASGHALTIDLEHGELRYDTEEAALKRLRDAKAPLREVDFHTCVSEGFFNKAHRIVDVHVAGVASAMVIDSGSETTALARNNAALPTMAKMMGGHRVVRGVGSRGIGLQVDGVPIEFAGAPMKVSATVLPASQVCGQGFLGADVLHRCTLVWGASSLWASCQP